MNKNNTESTEVKTSIGKKEIYFLLFMAIILLGLFVGGYNIQYKHKDESYRIIEFKQKDGKNYYSDFNLHKYKEKDGIVYTDTRMLEVGHCIDLYKFSIVSCRDKNADGIVSKENKNGKIILFKNMYQWNSNLNVLNHQIRVMNNDENKF